MKKALKWCIAAVVLIVIGIAVCVIAIAVDGGYEGGMGTVRYEENTHEVNESFRNISIDTETADVELVLSLGGTTRVECVEDSKAKHIVTVDGDTLTIKVDDKRSWFDHFGINIGKAKITVYLPASKYEELTITDVSGSVDIPKEFCFDNLSVEVITGDINCYASAKGSESFTVTTGDVTLDGITAENIEVKVTTGGVDIENVAVSKDIYVKTTTGRVDLKNITCDSITSKGTTGRVVLKNVIANGKMNVERTTATITFDACDAKDIHVSNTTGDVEGTLLTGKNFSVKTTTGDISVPQNSDGGKCEITTTTGDISITVK